VIHNAAMYVDPRREATPEGHTRSLAVNFLAPYALTAWISRPSRQVYMSSGMHRDGDASLRDIDWTALRWSGVQAYCDSKLFLTALALAAARRWPDVHANAVDPGWVPTRMAGPGAPDDLELGIAPRHGSPERSCRGGRNRRLLVPPAPPIAAPAALDERFQDALLDELTRLTSLHLP
jgi:NAD(P)-dependent dehydrogenase (short-subunit alcohol dehydrogenase family)